MSIDNFYWILFKNLLEPAGLDCWYYYPWGTQRNISKHEWRPYRSQVDLHHVLFHFDQEPLWNVDLGHGYDALVTSASAAWSVLKCKILANSEHSEIKRAICKDRSMIDWYFFYHGFAALDWYCDARYVDIDHPVQNAFLSFNHLVTHRRSYRIALLARLLDQGVCQKGSVSFHANTHDIMVELDSPVTELSQKSKDLICHNVNTVANLPWKLDNVPINGDLSARFGHNEYQLWQNSLLHLVNETVFYEPKLHLTEKVFKPIVAKRPFLLVAAPGNLEYIRSYGFRTFDHWIDESYDHIQDPDQRLDAIVHELARFARMSIPELRKIQQEMSAVLDFNKQHFFGKFREIIVGELVDNFDQCIRIWNNGRIDGRELPLVPDLDRVKQILLGRSSLVFKTE